MDQWRGKIAVVTGSSAGIGAAITVQLTNAGMIVVGLARRTERTELLKEQITGNLRKNLHAMKCDVSNENDIVATFKKIEKTFGGIDVLINNAGVVRDTRLIDPSNSQHIRETWETNVMGLVVCTREAYQSMKRRSEGGHVININSVVGHSLPYSVEALISSYNMYAPSKYAVTAITEVTRQELLNEKSNVKITSISPGAVKTEILELTDVKIPLLNAEDVAQAVVYVLSTPPHVQVHELTIKPVGERF
ncbi:farnesol dehydrogenase-like [Armigeres subalbatus]|uniref:farnesol dehydrogenase-like n=1 Tax=Armigeres subalbatus TaxID=124917 RepID=UPI002ED2691D